MSSQVALVFIVPTLNSMQLLPRLITSFKVQTYNNWRVLFIDGNSSKDNIKFLKNEMNSDSRFSYIPQPLESIGIYQAMSYGSNLITINEWVFFIGSDDWLSSPFALEKTANIINENISKSINIFIFGAKYFSASLKPKRTFTLPRTGAISGKEFSRMLHRGFIPTHQASCYSYKMIKSLMPYSSSYRLAADCEAFFRISKNNLSSIFCENISPINILAGGISSKQTIRRFAEVIRLYKKYFPRSFIIPIILRYFRKIALLRKNFRKFSR
tara:strand:+ start:317 stop:1126 length:810 start_codon:yes stop_codon:yes gene_type:complete